MSESNALGRRIPWGRLAAEGVLIVASILLAFAIEAWWAGRVERAELREALQGLQVDFRRNLAALDSARTANEAIQSAAEGLLGHTGPQGLGEADPSEIHVLVQGILNRHRFSAHDGHLQSLLNTGRWDQIESAALKEELTTWSAIFRNLSRREEEAVEGINNRLIVRIWELVPMRTVDMPIVEFREAVGPSRFPADYDRLLGDMYFEAAVDERWQDAFNLLNGISLLEASAQRVLDLIELELGGDPA